MIHVRTFLNNKTNSLGVNVCCVCSRL